MISKFKNFILFFIVLITIFLGCSLYLYYSVLLKYKTTEEVIVIIPRGVSVKVISDILYKNKIIDNKIAFRAIAKVAALDNRYLQSGEYLFAPGMNMIKVVKKILSGKVVIRKVTIPEGYTNSQIFKLLDSTYGLTGDIGMQQYKEGYLLPQTYSYKYGDTKASILNNMEAHMRRGIAELLSKFNMPEQIKNVNELLTLASIVEKETGLPEERPRIARVYLNRLSIGMPLQADPTVIYGITKNYDLFARKVTYNDISQASLYNTYKIKGLPPTPIANPGVDSIKAVLTPYPSNEIYFVADGKGGHHFSVTYEEHLINVRRYRNTSISK